MAYSDFTSLRQLEKQFGIKQQITRFLANVTEK